MQSTLTWHKFDIEDKASWPTHENDLLVAFVSGGAKITSVAWFSRDKWHTDADLLPYPVHYWAELPEYPVNDE